MTLSEIADIAGGKAKGNLKGTAKIVVAEMGAFILSEKGSEISDADADITLSATAEVFQNIMNGSQNPMMAVMGGKLKVDGSMGRAIKVGEVLTS